MTPKAEIKPEKKGQVAKLTDDMKTSPSTVFVDYSGMGMAMQTDLRSALREAGAKMTVTKNTLMKLAGKNAELPEEVLSDDVLTGQTAAVFATEDAVSPIQALGKFAKEFEMPKIKAGIVDGVFQDEAGVLAISKLPAKEELYAQAVGAVGAPMYGLVGTLQANLSKLVFVLSQASEKE